MFMKVNPKKRVLITGKNGQVGSELHKVLSEYPEYDCFYLGRNELPLEETLVIQDILSMYEPDIIIHTAAYTAVDAAEEDKEMAFKVNHLATEQIAEYCTVNEVKLIYISTDYVFDGTSDRPILEGTSSQPINIYGESKRKGELSVLHFCPTAVILRTSWVYSSFGSNFVKTMLKLLNEREQVKVVNDQVGSPTYAYDLAKAIVSIISFEKWTAGIYHYSNKGNVSWYEFAKAIAELKGLSCEVIPIPSAEFPTLAKRPAYSVLDTAKIQETYRISIPPWRKSLSEMLRAVDE